MKELNKLTMIMSSEQAKAALHESVKSKLKEDIFNFNEWLKSSIDVGQGNFCVNLPSQERVKQLAEFLYSKGYNVKAYTGIADYYICVEL